jgi:dCTP deaminase
MLMTGGDIRKAKDSGELLIENFDERSIQPASYDMRLGEEAITSSRREMMKPAEKGLLTISPGDFALVTTHEVISLPLTIAGHIGLRSAYAKKGLVLLSGPQIDPGFKGVLVVGLSNLSPRDIVIPYKAPFCTVEFFRLETAVTAPYCGEYQGQSGISARDMQNLVEAQGMTFGQIITSLQELSQNVKSLSESVKFLKWSFPAMLTFAIAVIAILIAFVN